MVARIRRNRRPPSPDLSEIEGLMKSISKSQELAAQHSANAAAELVTLHAKMKEASVMAHSLDDIVAERFCPSGRATNVIDPKKFQKAVSEKDFYACIKVGVTEAKKVLTEKQLAPMTQHTPGKPGPEQVQVKRVTRGPE